MKLLKDSFVLARHLWGLKGSREIYFLFTVAKICSFAIGVCVGKYLL